jgi:hypothetical protein
LVRKIKFSWKSSLWSIFDFQFEPKRPKMFAYFVAFKNNYIYWLFLPYTYFKETTSASGPNTSN